MSQLRIRKVAVLGAGVMGAQIAAHLVNVNVPVVLFDLPAKEGAKNGIVTKAVDALKKRDHRTTKQWTQKRDDYRLRPDRCANKVSWP